MKNKNYIVKGTPIVPAVCGIGMVVLWYLFFGILNGEWVFEMQTPSFSQMTGLGICTTVLGLLVPVLFFVGVLFLAELDLRWMVPVLLVPVVYQICTLAYFMQMRVFVSYQTSDFEYIFLYPFQFITPFLALILLVLTIEKMIPTKWVFVGFCGVAVLLPLILTLCGVGDFVIEGAENGYYYWSEYLSFALYYVGLGALAVQMRPPKESELTAVPEEEPAEEPAEEI